MIDKTHIDKIETFLGFIKQVEIHPLLNSNDLTLYRGQSNALWRLEPSIVRKGISSNFDKTEEDFIDEFKRLGRSMISQDVLNNNWDLLAFAQHYGLRTRLLDWSTNPLVALWFAFEQDIDVDTRAVWCMFLDKKDLADTRDGTPLEQSRTLAFKPNHVTQRITAQSAWFTTHKYVEGKGRFIPLDANTAYKTKLYKMELKNTLRGDILEALDKFGINSASMFPDLNGLTRYLNWKRV